MSSEHGEGRPRPEEHGQLQDHPDRGSGEGAASALEHMRTLRNQQRRLSGGESGGEAVPHGS